MTNPSKKSSEANSLNNTPSRPIKNNYSSSQTLNGTMRKTFLAQQKQAVSDSVIELHN